MVHSALSKNVGTIVSSKIIYMHLLTQLAWPTCDAMRVSWGKTDWSRTSMLFLIGQET